MQPRRHPAGDAAKRQPEGRPVLAAALGKVRTAATLAADLAGNVGQQFAGLDPLQRRPARSEEHTSELQSLMRISYAVFCLKQKKKHTQTNNNTNTTSIISPNQKSLRR